MTTKTTLIALGTAGFMLLSSGLACANPAHHLHKVNHKIHRQKNAIANTRQAANQQQHKINHALRNGNMFGAMKHQMKYMDLQQQAYHQQNNLHNLKRKRRHIKHHM